MIPVTKPFLPEINDYESFLKGIWQRQWLTNMGPLASDLEIKIKNHLKLNHLLFVTNGTVALQMAIKALNLTGEIITTPFSFIATTSSIVWEGAKPVFVDIDKNTLNIDVNKIEAAINNNTCAILATHVYGNPCDVIAIEKIAKKHNLKVIYDGAHAFGVEVEGESIFNFGDISTCSLHATKLYHSIEGGLVVTKDADLLRRLAHIRNFGFNGPETFNELGINGKNSEFHAAMGLVNLTHFNEIKLHREKACAQYDIKLSNKVARVQWNSEMSRNFSYYPIILSSENDLHQIMDHLKEADIYPRRYFYPSLNELPFVVSQSCPISEDISKRIICLPLSATISEDEINQIVEIINLYYS